MSNVGVESPSHNYAEPLRPKHAQVSPRGAALGRPPDLVELAWTYLTQRRLSPEIAQRAGIELTHSAAAAHPGFKKQGAFLIPYFHPLTREPMRYGQGRAFLRARYLGEEAAKGFTKPKKQQRFAQPKASPVFAYFAPSTVDWPSVLSDPAAPVVIVEGEFKGLCACAHNIPAIALGGVDSFQNNGAFLPELEAVAWLDRQVIVAYDSDLVDKPAVQAAERRLWTELKKRGARVHLARLPQEGDTKVGLDDLIARYGIERAEQILLQTPETSEMDPVIDLAPHRLVENLEQLDQAFAASDLLIFQRSGVVVHIVAAGESMEDDEVRRANDAPVIRQVSPTACQQLAMRAAKFTRYNERKKGPLPTACPANFAAHYLEKVGGWQLRPLKGIVEAPTIRPDGTVLQVPGYDEVSDILYLPSGDFPPVPDAPSKADALSAYAQLCHAVRGFEFASA